MEITPALVKQLREKTNAGMMDCKKALQEANGDIEKALEILRKKGVALASKKAGRATKEGVVAAYIHHGNKIGVLVEVNCETDFVARNEIFQQFVKDVTLQIASTNPQYISSEEIPEEVLEKEKAIFREQVKDKPPHVVDKIVEGKLKKWFQEVCLLDQVFIKPPNDKTIRDLLTETIARLGENITIRRFTRYCVGE